MIDVSCLLEVRRGGQGARILGKGERIYKIWWF